MNEISPQTNAAAAGKPNGNAERQPGKRRSKGESHASLTQLEERFRSGRDRFLGAMEALYPIAKRLKDDAAKAPLPDAAEVSKLASQLERAYSALSDAREQVEQRRANALLRSQQDLLTYTFAGLTEDQLKLAKQMMADGKPPMEIFAAFAAQAATRPAASNASALPAGADGAGEKKSGFFGRG